MVQPIGSGEGHDKNNPHPNAPPGGAISRTVSNNRGKIIAGVVIAFALAAYFFR